MTTRELGFLLIGCGLGILWTVLKDYLRSLGK